ncbi:YiiX/YebB-like N1pC/P60 family cysteine hydrolase [Bacillus sp. CGMCC 1.16541]|uniref:YiiX/YebB-like N1pC/P60 family cysteine hydrolase n=1 Tax=Bacillus sp. CGMCC 1.16541 TaxID=2185143 RepID=UPI000D7320B4|nr:YiiX/YebB-like N1pC/P60 family cysteine hydrolase [Bacillus sp. CGMCC 1.16541]
MNAKKTIAAFVLTGLILSPFHTYAQEGNSDEGLITAEFEKKIAVVDELLALEVGYEQEEQDAFVNRVNQIHIDIEDYLTSMETDIFYELNQYRELSDKLGELDIKADPYLNGGEMQAMATSWRYGDILYYGSGSNNAIGEKSFTGHTAVLSTTDYYVIEASKTANNGAKVHHWNRSNLWKGASGIKQLKVTTKLGTNATTTERKKAVDFGKNQVGEPYKLKTSIWSTDAWYCSKLTNAQWDHAGYNLQSSRAFYIDGLLAVIPDDILMDANTRVLKTWGTTLPGKI